MSKTRKIFFVMAGGGQNTDQHYIDTIKTRRSVGEFAKYLNKEEVQKLEEYAHGRPYAVWGAVPGTSNVRNWQNMEEGDYVMVYRKGKIILAAEVAMKTRNPDLAKFFWQEDTDGKTWELVYFMINDAAFDLPMARLNEYLEYDPTYHPQGFMAIKQEKVDKLLTKYGDLISLLQKLSSGEKVEAVKMEQKKIIDEALTAKIERAPTEHTEMQWRLIRLGNAAKFDVWVPANDQSKEFDGHKFRNSIIREFQTSLDVPPTIKNIDIVWKLGHSIKSAFEIEHSTSVYSGILRLADLRTETPNSIYPLFIVADRKRKNKVFDELHRPAFSQSLHMDKVVQFLSYDAIRALDEEFRDEQPGLGIEWLLKKAESAD